MWRNMETYESLVNVNDVKIETVVGTKPETLNLIKWRSGQRADLQNR